MTTSRTGAVAIALSIAFGSVGGTGEWMRWQNLDAVEHHTGARPNGRYRNLTRLALLRRWRAVVPHDDYETTKIHCKEHPQMVGR